MGGAFSTHGRNKKCRQNLKRRNHSEDSGISGKIILEWISRKQSEEVWTGAIRLMIATSDGLL
jgi:hypothetical protein